MELCLPNPRSKYLVKFEFRCHKINMYRGNLHYKGNVLSKILKSVASVRQFPTFIQETYFIYTLLSRIRKHILN
jgi:hypothetical protein